MISCSSYNNKDRICKSGFIQKLFCMNGQVCHSCGTFTEAQKPYCLSDDLPDRWLNDDGSSVFLNKP